MVELLKAKDITLRKLENLFGLQLAEDEKFFFEWQEELPEITDLQKQLLDEVKAGYLNLRRASHVLEQTVNMAVLSPLLFIGKFYLEPFELRSEYSLEITTEDEGTKIQGNIDFLLLKEQLWLVGIESKKSYLSVEAGLDQILAYLMSNPVAEKPYYGMITTGGEFVFIKLVKSDRPRYALSDGFKIRDLGNDLYRVLRILKHLADGV